LSRTALSHQISNLSRERLPRSGSAEFFTDDSLLKITRSHTSCGLLRGSANPEPGREMCRTGIRRHI
jgi:hypothetical protein